jgi:plastocyanin
VRRLGLICAAAAAALAVAAPAWAVTAAVPLGDDFFGHDAGDHAGGAKVHELKVKAGTVVRWLWVGTSKHNVTVLTGPQRFHSPTQDSGSYSRRVRRRGTYRIICTIHGRKAMSMILRVR